MLFAACCRASGAPLPAAPVCVVLTWPHATGHLFQFSAAEHTVFYTCQHSSILEESQSQIQQQEG
jgi:hypothetical protein